MSKRFGSALLLLLLAFPTLADKRRAVTPGAGRCILGVLAEEVFGDQVALDATHVYYVNGLDSTVSRVAKNGGAPQQLAMLAPDGITDIAIDATHVYIAMIPRDDSANTPPPGRIVAVPKGGGALRTIATEVIAPFKLDVDDTHVYWISVGTLRAEEEDVLADGKIERVAKDGTGRQTLASDLSAPFSLLLDGSNVYFGELGIAVGNSSAGTRRVPKSGGAVTKLQDDVAPVEMTQTATQIIMYGWFAKFPIISGLFASPKGVGPALPLEIDLSVFAGPRIANGFAYYMTESDFGDSVLKRVPVTGGTATVVRDLQVAGADFELDECGVYYVDYLYQLTKGAL
jgi:hypothetical protein